MQRETSNQITISFDGILNVLGLPLIKAYNGKMELHFLLDTGSSSNFVRTDIPELMDKCMLIKKECGSCYGIDKVVHKTQLYSMPFYIHGRHFNDAFETMPTSKALDFAIGRHIIRTHGILGIPFLIKNRIVLDFSQKSMYESMRSLII